MKVSVIIPVKNGADTLGKCLESLRKQTIANDIEIIMLDSMSTDASRKIALAYNVTVVEIPYGTFNHGLTRNLGVQYASGELIYLTVQDAWIPDADMLEKMVAHFDDGSVESVTGMQATPHELDKNPARWFKRFSEPLPEIRVFSSEAFKGLSAREQHDLSRWDNVNSMYRKTALLQVPFKDTNFAEDMLWAREAMGKGWKIIRDASLVVYHYHHHYFGYTFRVNYAEFYVSKKEFDVLPVYPSLVSNSIKSSYAVWKNKEISFSNKPAWMMHNILLHTASFLVVLVFRTALFIGGQKLVDRGLSFFCSTVPQGKQKAA